MPFPFVAPLKKWTVDRLKKREKDRNYITTLSPFAMITSGAVVLKGKKTTEEIKKFYEKQDYGSDAYYGCVVTNTTDIRKLYQSGKTIVGYDLNGKEIVVEGETNRRASVPIIQSIEIDTDGGNNTLKTAQVKIKVFTLKQLEMFELFFLRPTMNVVLEYGWSSDIGKGEYATTIDSKLFAKKNWKKYKEDYSAGFLGKEKKGSYVTTLKETGGEYDYMVGKVTNFSYSPQEDGTYDIDLQVSAGNELQLWPAIKAAREKTTTARKNNTPITNYKSIISKISIDLGIEELKTKVFADEAKWKNEFFNYGITNEKQKNTTVSKTPYISMKVIIEIINNLKILSITGDDIVITYEYKGNPIIPVNSNPNLISTNEYVLFPGDLPKITISPDGPSTIMDVTKRNDCKINGKSFNINNKAIYDFENGKEIEPGKEEIDDLDTGEKIQVNSNMGNLLNVFFSYDRFLEIFDAGNNIADIINPVLFTISDAMLGLSKLELQKPQDDNKFQGLEIVDTKIQQPAPTPEPYKFKIGAQNSIVKNFTFNMEMSTLMQAQALYSSQLAIAKAQKKISTDGSREIDTITSADMSYAINADGYFSVNDMEIYIVTEALKKETTTKTSNPEDAKKKKEEDDKLKEAIQSKYIKFLGAKEVKYMVYQDSGLVQLYLLPKSAINSVALTYLDISVEIDGMAGFSCGEYFQIEGIPEIYNRNGYFQITNVKQGIDENGWKTTIEAGFLIKTT
jgi:hypothetical protein